ncbi:hypothetical protein SO802_010336 [Lithocarpus litseifolius]|uniref:DUF4283 domain-containing protein n=1 Tax=Lithocarpus litseifolius TaxID=425828 RepID=A0AAW2DF52_9ROSI
MWDAKSPRPCSPRDLPRSDKSMSPQYQLMVHYFLRFIAYKVESGGSSLRCGTLSLLGHALQETCRAYKVESGGSSLRCGTLSLLGHALQETCRECSLSLFGRLLSDRHQNQRALKNTLKATWKMGSDLRIVEVGNNILQFKFISRYQLEWVEKSGLWNFDNNLLLLCRWRKGLTSNNISFSHSPFWVQIWGLPFENMTEEIGKEIGSKIGRVCEVDKRALQADQAKYERLPTFCYICGILGHDEKHCQISPMEQVSGKQIGEWLKAGGVLKNGGEKERVKVRSKAEKGSSTSMVVDGGAGEVDGVVRGSLPALVVGGGAGKESGTAVMMDVAPLNTVKVPLMCDVTSSEHRGQGEQIGWDNRVPKASKVGMELKACDEKMGVRAGLVRNEVQGNEVS